MSIEGLVRNRAAGQRGTPFLEDPLMPANAIPSTDGPEYRWSSGEATQTRPIRIKVAVPPISGRRIGRRGPAFLRDITPTHGHDAKL